MYNEKMCRLGEERSVIREIFEYGNARKREIGAENVFDFSIGNPSVPAPECVNAAIRQLFSELSPEQLHGYTSAPGAPEVRAAVADYIKREQGIEMPPGLIYMTCGAAASLTITLTALAEKGDEFVIIAPYFPEYKVYIDSAGGKTVEVGSDKNFHLDIPAIERAVGKHTKAVIINSPNNPSGAVYSEAEIKALAKLLKQKSENFGKPVFLITDEPYRELVYGENVPWIMPFYENTITCYSFSKSLSLAGERIGYIAVSPRAKEAYSLFAAVCGAGRSLGYICAPTLFQRVCSKCLGKSSDTEVYRANRDLLYTSLTEYGFACAKPDGAFYLFVKSPEPDAQAFCERAKKQELLLVPSDSFGIPGYVRISYCVSGEQIKRSLPAFKALAEEYFS